MRILLADFSRNTVVALTLFLACAVALAATVDAEEQSLTAREILDVRCSGCHAPEEEGGKLDAIEAQRKSPEGWSMTLSRMVRTHGATLQAGEARTLVKYLSDEYGLAPAEVGPFRFILEQRNTRTTQDVPEPLQHGCIQCHSYARIALQRRTADSWKRLPDAKVALMANVGSETASAGMLKDYWFDNAKKAAVPHLVKSQPFETDAWTKWQATEKISYQGEWLVVGHDPGKGGNYTGRLTLVEHDPDQYRGKFSYTFSDGSQMSGNTEGTVYAGYQWRGVAATKEDGGRARQMTQREIFFATEDGNTVSGRRLLTNLGDLGMDETWHRVTTDVRLLAVNPEGIRTGSPQKVRIFGTGFSGALLSSAKVSFGEGVGVLSLTLDGPNQVSAEIYAKAGVREGIRTVKLDGVAGEGKISVYDQVDYIRVLPERGFARPGGIRTPKIFQQYEAVAYVNGPDSEKGTDDDVRVGRVDPVRWKLEEYVKRPNDDDIQFVGAIDEEGLFHPNEDGPNERRHMLEGNVGDVWVEAWYHPEGVKRPMGARAHLLVMPAKFVFPPIE